MLFFKLVTVAVYGYAGWLLSQADRMMIRTSGSTKYYVSVNGDMIDISSPAFVGVVGFAALLLLLILSR